jgi:HlyD family secretion protein
MNVQARFVAGKVNDALLVPTVAIVSKHGRTGVLIPQPDGTPKFKVVQTGATVDAKTAVLNGLNEGDLVFLGLNKEQMEQQGYSDGSFGNRGGGGRGGGAPIPRSLGH